MGKTPAVVASANVEELFNFTGNCHPV